MALTSEQLERMIRHHPDMRGVLGRLSRELDDDLKDKSYQLLPLGLEVAAYLRAKRKVTSRNTQDAYESTLEKLARYFHDLELADLEPPVGTERIEVFLDHFWGRAAPATYNRHLSAVREFCKFQVLRGGLHGNPTDAIERAKRREFARESFAADQVRAILAAQDSLRDRIALRLLLHYGLRRGTLAAVQFKHFDHVRRRLTVFLKGGKVRTLPIPEQAFWHDLERHIIEAEAMPGHYLMTARWKNRYGSRDNPEKPMSPHGLHKWWYRCLANAGVVPEGVTSGERMHKARHTAGQAVLDGTGNLKAVQKLLGHSSIQTTGDVYTDWDVDALAGSLAKVYRDELEED